jgi:uncharacterized membrane protein YGL010W
MAKGQGLLNAFIFYGSYHANPINQLIHVICVPAIYTTALSFLTRLSIPLAVPVAARGLLRLLGETSTTSVSAALPAALLYAGYYLSLTVQQRPLLGSSAAALAVGALPLSHYTLSLGPQAMPITIGVHVATWLAQFYGHGVHEGRSPALLDNLWRECGLEGRGRGGARSAGSQLTISLTYQPHAHCAEALVMAPLFVYIESLMYLGFLKDFKAEVEPHINKAVEDFRKKK